MSEKSWQSKEYDLKVACAKMGSSNKSSMAYLIPLSDEGVSIMGDMHAQVGELAKATNNEGFARKVLNKILGDSSEEKVAPSKFTRNVHTAQAFRLEVRTKLTDDAFTGDASVAQLVSSIKKLDGLLRDELHDAVQIELGFSTKVELRAEKPIDGVVIKSALESNEPMRIHHEPDIDNESSVYKEKDSKFDNNGFGM